MLKSFLKRHASVYRAAFRLRAAYLSLGFRGSSSYWEQRYRRGDTSGAGSAGELARFKASVLNDFVRSCAVQRVIELGCGDGQQLALAEYPNYIGLDVSSTAVRWCIDRFQNDHSKSFFLYDPFAFSDRHAIYRADLTMSLDVIYHLTEDAVFARYMELLFSMSSRYIVIYSSNYEASSPLPHVRNRRFSDWIEANRPDWRLFRKVDNPFAYRAGAKGPVSWSDFYFYAPVTVPAPSWESPRPMEP
jgi:SAM-dependent methyltransferase